MHPSLSLLLPSLLLTLTLCSPLPSRQERDTIEFHTSFPSDSNTSLNEMAIPYSNVVIPCSFDPRDKRMCPGGCPCCRCQNGRPGCCFCCKNGNCPKCNCCARNGVCPGACCNCNKCQECNCKQCPCQACNCSKCPDCGCGRGRNCPWFQFLNCLNQAQFRRWRANRIRGMMEGQRMNNGGNGGSGPSSFPRPFNNNNRPMNNRGKRSVRFVKHGYAPVAFVDDVVEHNEDAGALN